MNKKKLVLREIIAILVATGIFLILFSILGGWKLQKAEQYDVITGAALISALIAGIISNARVNVFTSNAFFSAALAFFAVAVVAFTVLTSINAAIIIIIAFVLLVALTVFIITAEDGEKFALASLVIEGKIIFAVISAITFL